jgi:hypothetical protein
MLVVCFNQFIFNILGHGISNIRLLKWKVKRRTIELMGTRELVSNELAGLEKLKQWGDF